MSIDLPTLLPLYALGALAEDEARLIEEAVARDPKLQHELVAHRQAAHALIAGLAPIAPPPYLLERLLASVGGGRFERFADRFAAMFDVATARARELLGWIHDPAKWHPATPGVALIHFRGGPAHVGADCGVIKLAIGTSFPWHAHNGEELTLFMGGVARDHAGAVYQPGDELVQAIGSAHEFTSVGDDELIFAVRYRGVDFSAKRPV